MCENQSKRKLARLLPSAYLSDLLIKAELKSLCDRDRWRAGRTRIDDRSDNQALHASQVALSVKPGDPLIA
jgi:hypothetical protein